jgi:hypothetical protein
MTTTDWAVPGAKAAIYGGRGRTDNVAIVTIERLTATQIVIAGVSARYRRDNLRQVGDHYGSELLPANDPRVLAVHEREAVDRAVRRAKAGADKIRFPKNRAEAVAMLTEASRAIDEALRTLTGGVA